MNKKFEINQTKIKGGCQSGREVVTHNSKSDLTLASYYVPIYLCYKKLTLLILKYAEQEKTTEILLS